MIINVSRMLTNKWSMFRVAVCKNDGVNIVSQRRSEMVPGARPADHGSWMDPGEFIRENGWKNGENGVFFFFLN